MTASKLKVFLQVAHLKPMSPTLRPRRASKPTFSPLAPG